MKGLTKMILVGLVLLSAYFISHQLDSHQYYRFIFSINYCLVVILAVFFGAIHKSVSLLCYGTMYFFAAILEALMYFPALYDSIQPYYYEGLLNFCLMLDAMDWFIIITGGINVACSLYTMLNRNSSDSHYFDARVGLHLWAR